MANLQKIIKVTQEQYDILASGGTVGEYTGIDPNYLYLVKDTNVWATEDYVDDALDRLSSVAWSGDYSDLSNTPTIPTVNNGVFTIQANGTSATFFTANQSGNKTLNIKGSGGTTVTKSATNEITISTGVIPTKTSDLSNDNLLYRKVYNVDSVTRPTNNSNYVVYHITAPEISSYEEGLTIRVHKSLASDWPNDSTGAVKLLQVNNLDPIALFWRYNSFAAWNNFDNVYMTLTYATTARPSASDYYGYTKQAGFILDYTYDSGNDCYTLYDYGPFKVGSKNILQYSFTGYDVDGNRIPIINPDGTLTDLAFVYGRGIQFWDGGTRNANTSYNAWNGYFYNQYINRTTLLTAFVNRYSLNTVTTQTSLYFKCTMSGITMTVVGVTTTLPSTDDGYYYMFVGKPYTSYTNSTSNQSWSMTLEHPIYTYKNGAVVEVSTSDAYHIPTCSSGFKLGTGVGVADMYVPAAGSNQDGIVTTGNQTFAGDKNFTGEISVLDDNGTSRISTYASSGNGTAIKLYSTDSIYCNFGIHWDDSGILSPGTGPYFTYQHGNAFGDIDFITIPEKSGMLALDSTVSQYQSSSVVVGNAITNINGRVFQNYTATLVTAGGYTFYQILKSGSNPTEDEAKEYMRYMTGSTFLPTYNYDFPKQTIFTFADRSTWKPQYSSSDGLRLYRLTTPLALESEIPTNLENGTGENSLQQKGNTASGKDSFANGLGNTASNIQSHAEGFTTQAVGNFAHSEGQYTVAHADISHTEGVGNVVGDLTEVTVRSTGQGGHAEGLGNLVLGQYAHAEGANSVAKGDYSHVSGIGGNDWANPQNSEIAVTEFDEINYIKNTTVGHGLSYDATNNITYISGQMFGVGTQTFSAFVSRLNTNSTVKVIHSSGTEQQLTVHNKGTGYFYLNGKVEWLSGDTYLSVEIKQADRNIASGTAYGIGSYVGGFHNVAMQDYQTVVGKYNSNKSDTLFEVGNGTSNNSRSNAFEVYEDGTLGIPNFNSNGVRIGTKRIKCINGVLTVID